MINQVKIKNRIHGGKNSLSSIDTKSILDFSVSINPYGPPKKVKEAIKKVKLDEYPSFSNFDLQEAISKFHKISPNKVFIGNGSSEIIMLIYLCFIKQGDSVMSLWPSYGDYLYYAKRLKGKYIPVKINPPEFKIDIGQILRIIAQKKPRLFFLCNPNNPTGNYYEKEYVVKIIKAMPTDSFLILDEAYINFVENPWDSIPLTSNSRLIILRSLTKDYAVTNARLGYCIASEKVVRQFESLAPSWHINGFAQATGISIFDEKKFMNETRTRISEEKRRVAEILTQNNFELVPSYINSLLIKVKSASKTKEFLLDHNIFVRDCSSYDLPNYIRISIKRKKENDLLLKILISNKADLI